MGLFGLFKKKTNYFDKNISPRCSYCEHGKPAKSEGKILCPRCGIVDEDFSCKKFTYSPFKRIPEKEHPPVTTQPVVSEAPAKTSVTKRAENVSTADATAVEKSELKQPVQPEQIKEIHTVEKKDEEKADIPTISNIENHVAPKEIHLPDVSESNIASIHNTPEERHSEEYLKTVNSADIAEIKIPATAAHKLPDDTRIAVLNDMGEKK